MQWIGEHLRNDLLSGVDSEALEASARCFYRPEVFEKLAAVYRLTPRQGDVLVLVCQGCGAKEIAPVLHISPKTAETFCRMLALKMNVSGREQIILKAMLGSGVMLGRPNEGPDYGQQQICFGTFGQALYGCRTEPVRQGQVGK